MPNRPAQACQHCGKANPAHQPCTCKPPPNKTPRKPDPRSTQRGQGYKNNAHRRRFRLAVLNRDPICVICHQALATVADHYPLTRRELTTTGQDPNDPNNGRGLCPPCHNKHTATNQRWTNH